MPAENRAVLAAIAAAGGLACYGGSMFETGISATAGAHPFCIRNGMVEVPLALGLAIEVDEDRLRRYAL